MRRRRKSVEEYETILSVMPEKSGPGKPDKFWEQNKKAIFNLVARGFTNKEIAECLDVDLSTLYRWKKRHPDFFDFLKIAGDIADNNVVVSLYQKATGYKLPDTKVQWVEEMVPLKDDDGEIIFNTITGKPVMVRRGRWEKIVLEKHYPPDTTAMIFWLKNRRRDEWKDVQDKNMSGKMQVQLLPYDKDL